MISPPSHPFNNYNHPLYSHAESESNIGDAIPPNPFYFPDKWIVGMLIASHLVSDARRGLGVPASPARQKSGGADRPAPTTFTGTVAAPDLGGDGAAWPWSRPLANRIQRRSRGTDGPSALHQRVGAPPAGALRRSSTGDAMTTVADQQNEWDVLREGERVEAAEGLPDVPAGTPGVVVETYGLSWIRYRVRFDNGQELSLLGRRRLRRCRG
jgi:hypothetical protein